MATKKKVRKKKRELKELLFYNSLSEKGKELYEYLTSKPKSREIFISTGIHGLTALNKVLNIKK